MLHKSEFQARVSAARTTFPSSLDVARHARLAPHLTIKVTKSYEELRIRHFAICRELNGSAPAPANYCCLFLMARRFRGVAD